MKLLERNIKMLVTKGILKLDHIASKKGYVCSGHSYIFPYDGRFGKGYVVERANNLGFTSSFGHRKSNNYHQIEYYIYTK